MKILDRHIGTELAWPFLFGVAAFTSIFFAGQYLLKLTSQALQGAPVTTVIFLFVLYLPSVVVFTLPMATLLAVLVAFSKLSNDSEVVALYASGISLYRAMAPVVALGIVVTGFAFLLSEVIVPASARLSQDIQASLVKQGISTEKDFFLKDRATNTTIYVGRGFDAKSKTMRDVTITRYNDKGEAELLFQAESARWDGENLWALSNGKMVALSSDGNGVAVTFSGLETREIEMHQTPEDVARHQRKPEDMTYRELKGHIANMRHGGLEPRQQLELEVILYNKLAIPFAALIFALIGAPLAIRPARGSASVGIGLSILIIFGYWFVWHFTSALAEQGGTPPIVGAFTADALGIILGVILLIRTAK